MTYLPHGKVIIALQGALEREGFRSEHEREIFCQYLAKGMGENIRQSLLTFRANRHTEDTRPKLPPSPVPDHVQRERDRVASRPSI